MKILVIQMKFIGDVLASSIICNNLKKLYPNSQVDFLIYPFTKPVIENNESIDNIIYFEEKYRKSKKELFKFLLEIRKKEYDIIIDAYGKIESNLVTLFSKSKKKISYYKPYTSFLYTDTIDVLKHSKTNAGTALENRLNLISPLQNVTGLDIKPKIFLTDSEIEEVLTILPDLTKWANEITAYATDAAVNHGKEWNGFKVVEGRSVRKYKDEGAIAEKAVAGGYKDIYRKSLIPLTEMQKLMGKSKFEELLGDLIYKPPGKPTLVPNSDKRPAMNVADAKNEFNEIMED